MTNLNNLTHALNVLNISTPTKEECMICREELECSQCYTLPECNHRYHTNCLISWFRSGDQRCPYCGNKGINNKNVDTIERNRSRFKSFNYEYESQYFSDIKKYVYLKKNDENKTCIAMRKKFEKIALLEEVFKNTCANYKEFNQSLKQNPILYCEAKKQIQAHRTKRWKLGRQLRAEKFKIVHNSYIIPLLIPISVEV